MQNYFDIEIMRNAPEEAEFLLGSMFFTMVSAYNDSITKAWYSLHPDRRWVKAMVIDSDLMDFLAPPEVRSAEDWEFKKFLNSLQRIVEKLHVETENIRGILSDLWPTVRSDVNSGHQTFHAASSPA
jgi:hypothetical protein